MRRLIRKFRLKRRRKPTKLKQSDRGHARYFHGRKEILASFSDELYSAIGTDYRENGTIFLIQGAPGSGKTALLSQFSDMAKAGGEEVGGRKWDVLEIDETALYDPASLMRRAGQIYESGKVASRSRRSEAGIPRVIGRGGERTTTYQYADADILQTLEKLASRKPLLLVLDEVQTMEDDLDSRERKHLMVALKHIHNGKLAKQVVLACGGLGISSQVFGSLGISRFKYNCLFNLGRLSEAAEQAVIRDWLVKDGGAQETDIRPWITAIARETYGWPHHIIIYSQTAAKRLQSRNGEATLEDLDWVLQDGRAGKRDYYRQRFRFLSIREGKVFAHAMLDSARSGFIEREVLLERLMYRGSMSEEKASSLSQELLHEGLLSHVENGLAAYEIPIPSMKEYLFKEAGLKA